ncbi:uncharacterized protein DS421_9g265650 [Arachis hypogaea]|nr:uncharacterized protein DS421_9g265650 [Arachis hypogaea]
MAAVPLIAEKRHRCRCREPPLESVSFVSKAVVQTAGDFKMRRKGLCETFGL